MAKRLVFIDPDGTSSSELGVVVEHPTGVLYVTQCGGTQTIERSVEGYFVPVGGLAMDSEHRFAPMGLREPFHDGDACVYGGEPHQPPAPNCSDLPGARLKQLIAVVGTIPWWSGGGATGWTERCPLALDANRLSEIVEGWVPVLTTEGSGILIWPNCD